MYDLSRPQLLTELIVEFGHRVSSQLAEAIRIASAIQSQRRLDRVSKREGITRSTLLLALINVDPTLDEALASIGFRRSQLAALLKLTDSPSVDEPSNAYPEPELAEAVSDYLESIPPGTELGTADLAAAILASAEKGIGGRLSDRLKKLRVNYPAAFAALREIGAHGPAEPRHNEASNAAQTSDSKAVTEQMLGSISEVRCSAVITSRPWQLDIDALVISANPNGGLGRLGAALRANVQGIPLSGQDTHSLSPDRPRALQVSTSTNAPNLKWVILASARETHSYRKDPDYEGPGTAEAATRGMASAVHLAIELGVKSLAVPLLGAGAIGLPLEVATAANVRAVRQSLARQGPSSLQRVTFVGLDQLTIDAIQTAWRESELDEALRRKNAVPPLNLDVPPNHSNEGAGQITETTLLAGGISRDLVDAEERIPLKKDHLGVGTYVAMLATVIAGRDTPLPLSVGLFGEWGSGKSYFMGLLRGQVHELAHSDDEAYVNEVVPITFNAWHYSDTNLWASLGNEIFEQLAGPEATPAQHREALREELADALRRTPALEAVNEQAATETAQLRQKLEHAQHKAAGSATLLMGAVASSQTLGRMLKDAWAKLGVRHEAEQVQLLTEEIHQTNTELSALKMAAAGPRGPFLAALAVLAIVSIAASTFFRDDVANWVATGGVTALALTLAVMTSTVRRAREGLRSLRAVADEIRQQTEKATDEKVADELHKLREAEDREAVLQAQLTGLMQRAGELSRELAALSPRHRWYDFVSKRANSEEYSRELGLISTIRRDFERLIGLMKDWRELEEPEQHRPIDRIVLYIDDLDRCSPRQVVDVLQAVHLLLALDLFVVVVGVDPRWLLHSLREQYASVFPDRPVGGLLPRERPEADADWRTTPQDYLEKIFNIPFVLPGMTSSGFERLIRELSLGGDAKKPYENPPPNTTGEEPPAEKEGGTSQQPTGHGSSNFEAPDTSATFFEAELPAETGSKVADALGAGPRTDKAPGAGVKPAPWPLTEKELKLLAALGPLVRSPRQATRLLNLYRLVRNTRDLSPAADFLGSESAPGEFQAVAVLLGLLTAHPRLLGRLISAEPGDGTPGGLSSRPPTQSWHHVVEGLRPRNVNGRWSNDISGVLSEVDRREWTVLVQRVDPATALITLPDLAAFQLWGPRVTRFSFVLSPLAAQETQSGADIG